MAQVIGSVFENEIVVKLGYISVFDYYLIVRENERTAIYRTVYTVVWEVG